MISTRTHRPAFTIVELVIVIVVVGILAAISIVSYAAVTQNAKVKSMEGDLQTAITELNTFRSEEGHYPDDLAALQLTPSDGVSYQYAYDSTNDAYCITASISGASLYAQSGSRKVKNGGCPGHGVNGEAPVTNLATNPRATSFTVASDGAGWTNGRYPSNGTYTIQSGKTDGPVDGMRDTYARYTFTQVVGSSRGFHIIGNPEAGSPGSLGLPVQAGETYTISGYLRSTRAAGTARILFGARFVDGSNAWLGTTNNGTSIDLPIGSSATTPGAWVRPTLTVTAPAGAVRMQIYVRETNVSPSHSIGDMIEGTGLMITTGSELYEYRDGTYPGWIWNGSENAASSTGPGVS